MSTLGEVGSFVADQVLTFVLLKGTLLALAFGLMAVVLRRRSASTRSALWTLAAVALASLPLAGHVLPVWELNLVAFPRPLFRTDLLEAAVPLMGERLASSLHGPGLLGGAARLPLATWIAGIWLAGVCAWTGRFLLHRGRAARLLDTAEGEHDPQRLALVDGIRRAQGIHRPIGLAVSEAVMAPIVLGWRHPVVVLPPQSRTWPSERLTAVLYHELAHVQRGDYVRLWITEVVRAIYWPNPAVWLVRRAAHRAQELACDDVAVRAGMRSDRYALQLVEIARHLRRAPTGGALALLRRSFLRDRVRALLDQTTDRTPLTLRALARSAVLILTVLLTLGAAELWRCDTATGPPAAHRMVESAAQPAA